MKLFLPILGAAVLFGQATARSAKPNKRIKEIEEKELKKQERPQLGYDSGTQRKRDEVTPFIVGGNNATPYVYPYFVDMNTCGGSLIAPDVVLTAGHCSRWDGDTIGRRVVVGAVETGQESYYAEFRTIVNETRHPLYAEERGSISEYDFMLLHLDTPYYHPMAKTLKLNQNPRVPKDGQDIDTIGFGWLDWHTHETPDWLQQVTLQAFNTRECNTDERYDSWVKDEFEFCAGVEFGGKGACRGDSGGPVLVLNSEGVHTQVGVVSWGGICGADAYPSVFARVSFAVDWIKDVVCDHWGVKANFCHPTLASSRR